MFQTEAKVTVKDSQGKIVAQQPYNKVVFEGKEVRDGKIVGGTAEELLGEAIGFLQSKAGEKGNGVLDLLAHLTYSYDLGERAKIRQSLVGAVAGPDKAIAKMVKDYMAARAAMGKPVSEEQALAKVQATLAD